MQIQRDQAVEACRLQDLRQDPRSQRSRPFRSLVLARVCQIRHGGDDALRARPPRRVRQEKQLEQRAIRRGRERLDQVDVPAADILVQLDVKLIVGEARDGRYADREAQRLGDRGGEERIPRSG